MSRTDKRKAERLATGLVTKAKKDMLKWVESIGYVPSESEMKAWQDGYVAGINRYIAENEDK